MIAYSYFEADGRLHRYAFSLLDRGDEVHCIGLGDGEEPSNAIWKGVNLFRLISRDFRETSPFSYLWRISRFYALAFLKITSLHFKHRYDVIHYHNVPDHGIFVTWIAKLFGAKIILDIHDIVPEFYMRKFNADEKAIVIRSLKFVEKLSCFFASHVITVTELWRQRLIERSLRPKKCTVIMNLPIESVFKPLDYSINQNQDFLVSYHGALTEPTGVNILVKAVGLARKYIPNIKLQIIGSGRELAHLQQLAQELKMTDIVQFIHTVGIEEVPKLLSNVTVGVDPKLDGMYAGETLSVKVMEYLGLHLPAIVSGTPVAHMYFQEDQVLFFTPGDPEDLAKQMIHLYENPKLLKTLSDNAESFNSQYNWKNSQETYFQLLDKLCSSK